MACGVRPKSCAAVVTLYPAPDISPTSMQRAISTFSALLLPSTSSTVTLMRPSLSICVAQQLTTLSTILYNSVPCRSWYLVFMERWGIGKTYRKSTKVNLSPLNLCGLLQNLSHSHGMGRRVCQERPSSGRKPCTPPL